jgi:hypothetical protein
MRVLKHFKPMTIKAVRATITLGDIDLDVYQLPDGQYFLSLTQVAETIDMPLKRMSEIRELKMVQTLYPQGFRMSETVKVEGGTKPVTIISLDDVSKYWTLAAFQTQNAKAMSLLAASQAETLERRADHAFGAIRDEKERNDRLAARTKGKVARRSLTDAIQDYTESHEVSDNYKRWIISNCSDHLNKIILGAKAKQAKKFYQLPENSLLRNHIPVDALRELELAEEMASRLIEERDMEPLEAVKQACVVCFTRSVGLE